MTTPISVVIDATGIHAPTFDQVLAYIQQTYRSIYGQDIQIDADKQDGQLLAFFATLINDCNSSCVAAFNSFRPAGAVGAGLASIVKINGITKKAATSSQVTLTLGGTAGTPIGVGSYVGDNLNLGTQWFILGTPLSIPDVGQIDVQALCVTPGAISAAPGTLTNILSPTPGWQSVTNANAAVVGRPVQTDAQLRRQQTQSTAIPAQTVTESITGNLLNLPDVTRAKVYNNDTATTSPDTIPPRTISAVVEGGTPNEIATVIARTKTPGVPTYGDVSMVVYDRYGLPDQIYYFQLIEQQITVLLWLKPSAGYTDTIGGYIQAAIAYFLNDLDIGADVFLADLFSPAKLNGDEATGGTGQTQATLDTFEGTYTIPMPYGLAVARSDMQIAGGPYPGGSVLMNVINPVYFALGNAVWITLSNNTYYRTTIIGIAGTQLTFADPVPALDQVNAGALVFLVGDVPVAFNEAAQAIAASVILQLLP